MSSDCTKFSRELTDVDAITASLTHRAFAPPPFVAAPLTSGFERKLAHGVLRGVAVKVLLFVEGDLASHVYRIETGAIALNKVLADGRRQVIGF